jgi:two-component system nitrogen regulation sensor histidine kinase GlnL
VNQVTFVVDDQLRFVSWDKTLEVVSGRTYSQVQGMMYHEVLPVITLEGDDAVKRSIQEERVLKFSDYLFHCLYGDVKADIHISPLVENNGNRGAQVSIRSKPFCTLALRLQQSQPLIDIGKVASTLAHGVRNPLNAIKGGVVYLKTKYAGESTLIEFADMMEEEITRLDSFITRFLSTSFFDNELAETDLNALLGKIETYISLQAAASDIISRFVYGDIPRIRINPFQLEQALLNIVNNAMDAMIREGELTVSSAFEFFDEKEFVVINVTDSGPGMPEAGLLDTQGPLPGASQEQGKGFGLFIAREVVQHHGGRLEIRSVKGSGTTVRVCLPVV